MVQTITLTVRLNYGQNAGSGLPINCNEMNTKNTKQTPILAEQGSHTQISSAGTMVRPALMHRTQEVTKPVSLCLTDGLFLEWLH